MTSNEQHGLDAAVAAGTPKSIRDYRSHRERIVDAIAAYLEATSLREDTGIPSPSPQMRAAFESLLAASEKVLDGLHARIDAADKRAVPVFHGIVDLHDAIHEARAALSSATPEKQP